MKIEFNALTGKMIERDFTVEELEQIEIDRIAQETRQAKEAEKAKQRAAILERLGLTEDEAKLILS